MAELVHYAFEGLLGRIRQHPWREIDYSYIWRCEEVRQRAEVIVARPIAKLHNQVLLESKAPMQHTYKAMDVVFELILAKGVHAGLGIKRLHLLPIRRLEDQRVLVLLARVELALSPSSFWKRTQELVERRVTSMRGVHRILVPHAERVAT